MNAIIIDDEKNGAEALQLLIEQHCDHVTVIAVEHSPEAGISSILNLRPDLVFLDIEMPTGTGFDVVEATKDLAHEVVFTTAYSHYAIKAFKTHAVDYLLKPVDVDELVKAVESVQARIRSKNAGNSQGELNSLLKKISAFGKKIAIPASDGVMFVTADEIMHLESDSNYTNVFLKDGKKILVSKTLKSMEDQLKDYDFCRVHSAHLVNLNEVERYIKGDGGTLVLKDKTSIPVSRANKQELLNKIGL